MKNIFLLFLALASNSSQAQLFTPNRVDLRPLMSPVKNQMYRGSCVAFASIAAMEFYTGVPRLSEAYTYTSLISQSPRMDGITLPEIKNFLVQNPIVPEELMSYDSFGSYGFNPNVQNEVEIAKMYNRAKSQEAAILKPMAIYQANNINLYDKSQLNSQTIINILQNKRIPVVGLFKVNTKEMDATKSSAILDNNFYYTLTGRNDNHAMLIVGYQFMNITDALGKTKTKLTFIIRNSWGIQWGDRGYAYMTSDYLEENLLGGMTIGGVNLSSNVTYYQGNTPELFKIRANSWREANNSITTQLSLTLMEPYITQSEITSVHYENYVTLGNQKIILHSGMGDMRYLGYPIFYNQTIPYKTFWTTVKITHRNGMLTTFTKPVSNIFSWSDRLDD